jgi:flagellin-specific chaperone FliS
VDGTIDAADPFSAYKRLISEYHFNVLDLYPEGSTQPENESYKDQFGEWNHYLEQSGISTSQKAVGGVKSELEDEGVKLSQEIIDEIDSFIINAKNVIQNHSDKFSEPFMREIEKKLGELERIRASNNLKHITKVCNDLYDLISHPDQADKTEAAKSPEYTSIISKLRTSGFINNQLNFLQAHTLQKKAKRFEKIQGIFSKIMKSLNKGKADEIEKKFAKKVQRRHSKWMNNLTASLKGKKEADTSRVTLKQILSKFFEFVSASNPIMRRARREEMAELFREWRRQSRQRKETKSLQKSEEVTEITPKKDFNPFFLELDSFIGWLLFFYVTYFFLVSFSLTRGIGLPDELVIKTIQSPLILNILIFLLLAHLAFKLKIRFFHRNVMGSAFLFFLTAGIYAMVIVNF